MTLQTYVLLEEVLVLHRILVSIVRQDSEVLNVNSQSVTEFLQIQPQLFVQMDVELVLLLIPVIAYQLNHGLEDVVKFRNAMVSLQMILQMSVLVVVLALLLILASTVKDNGEEPVVRFQNALVFWRTQLLLFVPMVEVHVLLLTLV